MSSKRSAIAILVGVNLFLLALLIGSGIQPASAYAQTGGRAGDFSCVTAKTQGQSYDAVYVLDRPGRKLHVFYPTNVQRMDFAYGGYRDLKADFRN